MLFIKISTLCETVNQYRSQCKQKRACRNNQKQNFYPNFWKNRDQSQCRPEEDKGYDHSVCRQCCFEDLCTIRDGEMWLPETRWQWNKGMNFIQPTNPGGNPYAAGGNDNGNDNGDDNGDGGDNGNNGPVYGGNGDGGDTGAGNGGSVYGGNGDGGNGDDGDDNDGGDSKYTPPNKPNKPKKPKNPKKPNRPSY